MRLVAAPSALLELQDAASFYALNGSLDLDLALAFVAEFERATELVLANPKLGAVFRGSRRRYVLRRFPYSIVYRPTKDELQVLAVAHHRRRPT